MPPTRAESRSAAGDAIARIAELRAGLAGARLSPETPGQIELVRGWRHGW